MQDIRLNIHSSSHVGDKLNNTKSHIKKDITSGEIEKQLATMPKNLSEKEIMVLNALLSSYNEINLYGKVIDQNNKPVIGADIEFLLTSSSTWKGKLVTDNNGEFSILNQKGRVLDIFSIKKSGYRFKNKGRID